MNIGVIGAGNVGKALAGASVKAGHQVTISAAHAEKAAAAAKEVGCQSAETPDRAVKNADLVILAVPSSAIEALAGSLGTALDGKVVVDPSNRIGEPADVLDGDSVAERLQKLLPKAHVVKAFNYMFASRMKSPAVDGMKLDALVAGDDEGARQKVLELAGSIGLRPVDVGPLAFSRALESMGLLLVSLQRRHGWPWQNGWKLIGPPA
jgi:NADPH-dependent F420 reductase